MPDQTDTPSNDDDSISRYAGEPSGSDAHRVASRARLLPRVTGVVPGEHNALLASIRQGLPFQAFELLAAEYKVSYKALATVLCIPYSTLSRRRSSGRFRSDESDRIARLANLKDMAVAMTQGDQDAAIQWLGTPNSLLGDETPLQHADTELGVREVEALIGRIRHGVFS